MVRARPLFVQIATRADSRKLSDYMERMANMNFVAFVGPALRLFGRLRAAVNGNPKTAGTLGALAVAVAGWLGLRPEDMAAIGSALVAVGQVLQRLGAGGM